MPFMLLPFTKNMQQKVELHNKKSDPKTSLKLVKTAWKRKSKIDGKKAITTKNNMSEYVQNKHARWGIIALNYL